MTQELTDDRPAVQPEAAPIIGLLRAEQAAIGTVLECLQHEAEALVQRDAAALLSIAGQKADAVSRAAGLAQTRRALLRDHPAADTAGSRELLSALEALTARCRELNDMNGLLIRAQRRRVEGTLNLLRGGQAAPDSYGRDGETRLQHRARVTLASC
ncbi:MAG: flagellar export chaperone FlgN [Gammaproteobacteria bacterium]|nr:flagellar export chaperone FlgN [Gammaproteobacteria bacterium]